MSFCSSKDIQDAINKDKVTEIVCEVMEEKNG